METNRGGRGDLGRSTLLFVLLYFNQLYFLNFIKKIFLGKLSARLLLPVIVQLPIAPPHPSYFGLPTSYLFTDFFGVDFQLAPSPRCHLK